MKSELSNESGISEGRFECLIWKLKANKCLKGRLVTARGKALVKWDKGVTEV